MAKRKRIGIPFFYNEGWIAGSYYIKNLVHSLQLLDDWHIPELYILYWKIKDFEFIKQSGYPYLKYLPFDISYNIAERILNNISRTVQGKNIIVKKYTDKQFDVVFPYQGNFVISKISNKIFWIPDFQERYFPDLFSQKEVEDRKSYKDGLASAGNSIIFSSENARNDFNKFYPDSNCKTYVLHFASTHPEYNSLDINALKQKYNINGDYFFSPNQFWKHKNHMVVINAIKLLKESGLNFTVVFTGKEYDSRNPDYFTSLKAFVEENNLQEQVRFLGFIDRREQLKLMSASLAVIQPSLFEGWSTVVEDAKEMNQYVVLSDIGVHREQLDYNVSFFDPNNAHELADKMTEVLNGNIIKIKKDYSLNVRKFGSDFMEIVNKVSSK